MNPFARLVRELRQLHGRLDAGDFRAYCMNILSSGPSILGTRNLTPADRKMVGDVAFRMDANRSIVVPVGALTSLFEGRDDTSGFSAAREMLAGNVYLRGFRPNLRARTVLDLGSNRGLFLALAATVLDAELAIGVEPLAMFAEAFELVRAKNGLDAAKFIRYERCVASVDGPGTITIRSIMERSALDRIEFVKCDIEGGEFDVLMDPAAPLDRIDNLAMELHPDKGDVGALVSRLAGSGFGVAITDQFNTPCDVSEALYLYASRTGDLAASSGQGQRMPRS